MICMIFRMSCPQHRSEASGAPETKEYLSALNEELPDSVKMTECPARNIHHGRPHPGTYIGIARVAAMGLKEVPGIRVAPLQFQ
jgi:hypothetical protein